MENDMPIHLFKLQDRGNIERVATGEHIGTLIAAGAR
jgi:uridylate kinase